MFPVEVEGDRLRLRELTIADHHALCQLWGDPVIARHMAFSAMTAREVDQAIAEARAETRVRPRSDYTLGAVSVADNALVGTIRMTEQAQRSVYLGRLTVLRALQNQGYAPEIVDLACRFCFTTLKAHRVWGVVHVDNQAAKQAVLYTGMTLEGCVRDFFYARGEWHSVYSYSILEHEWPHRFEGLIPVIRRDAFGQAKHRPPG